MSVERVTIPVVQVSCDLCHRKADDLCAWNGFEHTKQYFVPNNWRRKEKNGVPQHVCPECCDELIGGGDPHPWEGVGNS